MTCITCTSLFALVYLMSNFKGRSLLASCWDSHLNKHLIMTSNKMTLFGNEIKQTDRPYHKVD